MGEEVQLLDILKALFATVRNLAIVGMSWGLAWIIGKVIPNAWVKVYKAHVVPALLLIICMVSVWVPGLRPGYPGNGEVAGTGIDGSEIGWRIALGVILAVGAYVVPIFLMWLAEKYLPASVVKQIKKIM